MRRKSLRSVPAGLEAARGQFERWRATDEPRTRIPERLWAVAVTAAGRFGVHRTSRALRLDYAVLKKRYGEAAEGNGAPRCDTAHPNFVELVPGGVGSRVECVVEVEEPSGTRMRIEVKGVAPADLVALTRSLRAGGA